MVDIRSRILKSGIDFLLYLISSCIVVHQFCSVVSFRRIKYESS